MGRIGGVSGAFAAPTGFGADFAGFDLNVGQVVENDTVYAATAASHIGNGLPLYRMSGSGFLKTGSTPGFTVTGTTLATGASATATFATGNTLSGVYIVEDISASNGR